MLHPCPVLRRGAGVYARRGRSASLWRRRRWSSEIAKTEIKNGDFFHTILHIHGIYDKFTININVLRIYTSDSTSSSLR